MTEATATMARTLAMLSHVRHDRKGQRALLRDRILRVLVTDLGNAVTGRRRPELRLDRDADNRSQLIAARPAACSPRPQRRPPPLPLPRSR
jgi:hypothetical protein